MNLDVGIDVGKTKLSYCGLGASNKPTFQGDTSNDTNGAKRIKQEILDWINTQPQNSVEQVIIGMEATSVYHYHVMMYFMDDAELSAYNTLTVPLNPKSTHKFSRLVGEEKTDRIDAEHIALQLRTGLFEDSLNRSEEYLALQRLTRERATVVRELAEAKNHYLNNLFLKLNTVESQLDTSIFSSTMMTLLSGDEYPLGQLARMNLADLTALIDKLSRHTFRAPEKLAKELHKSIEDSYSLNNAVAHSVDLTLSVYYHQIRMYEAQVKQFETAINQLAESLPAIKCIMSIPGIGPVYAAGIAAEIGQIERFPDDPHLAKYAGLAWNRNESGSYTQQEKNRTKTGDQYLRYYLVEAADSVRKHDPVFAAYYAKKYKEVNNHQHHRADILTARKLVRVIYALLVNHQLYQQPTNGIGIA